ncbi:MAG: HAMP domain-containing histidine kinase [Planctomycetes bacterium]|nr:HAMP domain-containing histidine kinase [Planctomycetota bacterium]
MASLGRALSTWRDPWPSYPLRWKLAGLYLVVITLVIVTFGLALLIGWRRSGEKSLDAELETRARALCALAEREGDRWFLEEKSGIVGEYAPSSGRYFRVRDAMGGGTLMSSPLAPPPEGCPFHKNHVLERPWGEKRFREVTLHLTKSADEDEGLGPVAVCVSCGADLAAVEESVMDLLGLLCLMGPAVLCLSLAGGLFIAARALRPIGRMAATAESIQATDLSRRIEVQGKDELARLAHTLNAMFDRLQEAFDRQTRFTADASHELRTPLSVIAGSVELGLKQPRTPEEHREILADVREASDRMRSIVEGLLVLARADAKAAPLRREPVSLTALADEISRLCRPLAERHTVSLVVESAGEVRVTGDPGRLKDLLSNLVTNAIRYNRPGGTVTVRLSTADGRARMEVDDTGIGIPAEDLPHVFERFYRVDKTRSRAAGGSGLGLAIARWAVDAHGGTIEASSRPGEGSRFVVHLPPGGDGS